MKKIPSKLGFAFFGAQLFSLTCIQEFPAYAADKTLDNQGLCEKIIISPSQSYMVKQELFKQHVLRHHDLIHTNSKEGREAFKECLTKFVVELKVWKAQSILLRASSNSSFEYLLDSLNDLPYLYIVLGTLAHTSDPSTFGTHLEYIEDKWGEGTHFNLDSSTLNIFKRQHHTLERIRHDLEHMITEYTVKMEKVKDKPAALIPTLEMLKKVVIFGNTYEHFIKQLEHERLDFICLCQLLYPIAPDSLNTSLQSLQSLISQYEPPPSVPESSLAEKLNANPSPLSPKDQSSRSHKMKKSVSIRETDSSYSSTSDSEYSNTESDSSPSLKKEEKLKFISKLKFGSHKKKEAIPENNNGTKSSSKKLTRSSFTPRFMKRSGSSDDLNKRIITPRSNQNETKQDIIPGVLNLPSPLPAPTLDSPTRAQTMAPRSISSQSPSVAIDLSPLKSELQSVHSSDSQISSAERELEPPLSPRTPISQSKAEQRKDSYRSIPKTQHKADSKEIHSVD